MCSYRKGLRDSGPIDVDSAVHVIEPEGTNGYVGYHITALYHNAHD